MRLCSHYISLLPKHRGEEEEAKTDLLTCMALPQVKIREPLNYKENLFFYLLTLL